MAGPNADIVAGNALALKDMPVGTIVHNVELYPGNGAQLARSAGNSAQLMALEGAYALLRLPSGELRNVPRDCMATVGLLVTLTTLMLKSVKQVVSATWVGDLPFVVL